MGRKGAPAIPHAVDFLDHRGILRGYFRGSASHWGIGAAHFHWDVARLCDCVRRSVGAAREATGSSTTVQDAVRSAGADSGDFGFVRVDGEPSVEYVDSIDWVAGGWNGDLFRLRAQPQSSAARAANQELKQSKPQNAAIRNTPGGRFRARGTWTGNSSYQ